MGSGATASREGAGNRLTLHQRSNGIQVSEKWLLGATTAGGAKAGAGSGEGTGDGPTGAEVVSSLTQSGTCARLRRGPELHPAAMTIKTEAKTLPGFDTQAHFARSAGSAQGLWS